MTHGPTVETFDLLQDYVADRALRAVATFEIRGRSASHKIRRAARSATGQLRRRDRTPVSTEDFSDPHSQCVLDAVADALLGPLVLQAARDDDEAEWLTRQQGHP